MATTVYLKIIDLSLPTGSSHVSTDWELASDPNFTTIVWQSVGDTVNLTTRSVVLTTPPTSLYARARVNLSIGSIGYAQSTAVYVDGVLPPTITIDGEPYNIPVSPQITVSPFSTTVAGNTHTATDWIVVDENGIVIEKSLNDTTNLTSYTISTLLSKTRAYTVYVRQIGSSVSTGYVSKRFICLAGGGLTLLSTPSITVQGEPDSVPQNPIITGSAFAVLTGYDSHQSTDWIIVDTVSGTTVWQSLNDTVDLTSIQVPVGTLQPGTEYLVKVRYNGLNSTTGFVSKTITTLGASGTEQLVATDQPLVERPVISEASNTQTSIGFQMSPPNILSGDVTVDSNEWFILDVSTNTIVDHVVNTPAGNYTVSKGSLTAGNSYRVIGRYRYSTGVSAYGYYDFIYSTISYVNKWKFNPSNYPINVYNHSQSTLPDGRVLVVGGRNSANNVINQCYIYNPTTDTWTTAANYPTAVTGHSQSTLLDGRVLVVGGWDGANYLNNCNIYDPATNAWTAVTPLPIASSDISQSTLPDGRVLVVTGNNNLGIGSTLAYIYDPATNTWTQVANYPLQVANTSQSALPDGRVLVVGGNSTVSGAPTNQCYLYDPTTDTWTAVANYPTVVTDHTQSTLPDGRVLVVGGHDGTNIRNECYIYDPTTDTWTPVANYPTAIRNHTQSILPDGRVLVVGGITTGTTVINTCYIYDPTTDIWAQVTNYPINIYNHTQSTLSDGRVLVVGGNDGVNTTNNCYLYDPTTDTWTPVANYPTAIRNHTQSTLSDGRVLVVGGINGANTTNSCYLYDPTTDTWTTAANYPTAVYSHTQSTLSDGRVLVVGGWDGTGTMINQCHIYDPTTNTWTPVANYPITIANHSQSTLLDGRVLVVSGISSNNATTVCYIYDPTTDIWSAVSNYPISIRSHSQSTLLDGNVLVVGGTNYSANTTTNQCYIYNPTTDTWTFAANYPIVVYDHTQSTLQDGSVLVVGGHNNTTITLSFTAMYY